MSLPPRECGLKFFVVLIDPLHLLVAPSAGAWIEITTSLILMSARIVAPSAGAWIEITDEKSVSSVLYCLNVKLQVP